MKVDVAISSNPSSQVLVEPLTYLLSRHREHKGNQVQIDFKDCHTITNELSKETPAPLLIALGGAETSNFEQRLNGFLNEWYNCNYRKRPSLLLISSDYKRAQTAVDEWLSKQAEKEELRPYVSVCNENLHEACSHIADLSKIIDASIDNEMQRRMSFRGFAPGAEVSTSLSLHSVRKFPDLAPAKSLALAG